MKYSLFIDNFRGFENAYIPITDVNFLVGENSTGKTSVLSLIKILSNPQFFLFNQEFGDEHVSFGHFSDIVSAHSEDRSYFRIGVIWQCNEEKKDNSVITAWLLTYVEDKGLPRLSRYTLFKGSEKISLQLGSKTFFKREKYRAPQTAEDIRSKLFPRWIEEHSKEPDGFQKLAVPANFPSRIPVVLAMSMIRQKETESFSLTPSDVPFSSEIVWIAPIRTKPRRTYDELTREFSPEGAHTPYLIREILHSKAAARFRAFIGRIGKASGLFHDVRTKNFGRGTTAPFEVDIVLDGKPLNLNAVGYGVSQSLPVLVEIIARPNARWFAIQQPEVHLHPRAQAALGDLFFEMAVTDEKHFLVETHSDFMIDRFRMKYADEQTKPDSQILFFERQHKHNTVTSLPISDKGELPANQPAGYRDFFIREEIRLLGI